MDGAQPVLLFLLCPEEVYVQGKPHPRATLPTTSVSHNTVVVVLIYVGAWTTSETSVYVPTSMMPEMLYALLPERVLAYNINISTAVR